MILCRDHNYYLRRDEYEKHLRRFYVVRDSLLKRVIIKIRDLSQLHKFKNIQNSTSEKASISELIIISDL